MAKASEGLPGDAADAVGGGGVVSGRSGVGLLEEGLRGGRLATLRGLDALGALVALGLGAAGDLRTDLFDLAMGHLRRRVRAEA